MRLAAAGAAALVLTGAGALAAQVTVRAGAVRSSYAALPAATALSLSPRLDWSDGPARAAVEAGWSQFDGGGWVAQAGFQADETHNLGSRAAMALVGAASGNWLNGGTSTWQARVGGQAGVRAGPLLLSAGAGAGAFHPAGGGVSGSVDAAAAASVGPAERRATARVTRTGADSLRYTDLTLLGSWRRGPVSLEAAAGGRRFDGGSAEGAWSLQAALARGRATFDVAAGRYARSPEGFARGFYLTAGIRLRLTAAPRPAAGPAALVTRLDGGRVRLRLSVPGAVRVSLAGSWNGWTPAPMMREGDAWVAVLPLAAGAYEFGISVDGGPLMVPPGVPAADDEFGGKVGLLVVR